MVAWNPTALRLRGGGNAVTRWLRLAARTPVVVRGTDASRTRSPVSNSYLYFTFHGTWLLLISMICLYDPDQDSKTHKGENSLGKSLGHLLER